MGTMGDHIDCKLVMPLLISDLEILEDVLKDIKAEWGDFDYQSDLFTFEQTSYYDKEMGLPIYRAFYCFTQLIEVTDLVSIKHKTNLIEDKYTIEAKRRVNLDPGYMCPGKFVLATTKNQQHRLYIREGIFEEITLYYHAGQWKPHPWTYADYQSEKYRTILGNMRKIYITQVADVLKQRGKK